MFFFSKALMHIMISALFFIVLNLFLLPIVPASFLSCSEHLKGTGDLDTECELNSSLNNLPCKSFILGKGSLIFLSGSSLELNHFNCEIHIRLDGKLRLHSHSKIVASTIILHAEDVLMESNSIISSTGLGNSSETESRNDSNASSYYGYGGGYGGRGAFCFNEMNVTRGSWGGEAFGWYDLENPWRFGNPGKGTNASMAGGAGGGRLNLIVGNEFELNGTVTADGSCGGLDGGGGSGGSIVISAQSIVSSKSGKISAAGGNGFSGGGGGRIAVNSINISIDLTVKIHGGQSLGCKGNAGASGTIFYGYSRKIVIDNDHYLSRTGTPVLTFPRYPPWEDFTVRNRAVVVPDSLYMHIIVHDALNLIQSSALRLGNPSEGWAYLEVETKAILLRRSTIQVYGAMKSTSAKFTMDASILELHAWLPSAGISISNSKIEANDMTITGGSVLTSTGSVSVRGQGSFFIDGSDSISASTVFISLYFTVEIALGGSISAPAGSGTKLLYCDTGTCPSSVILGSEDCLSLEISLFSLQLCRVERLYVYGEIRGSVIHLNVHEYVHVAASGVISTTALGCEAGSGVGSGECSPFRACGGGGHGGWGGNGAFNGSAGQGGSSFGNASLPCELGSGSGILPRKGGSSGGGVIVIGSNAFSLKLMHLEGCMQSDGETYSSDSSFSFIPLKEKEVKRRKEKIGGSGGGAGGSVLLFVEKVIMTNGSVLTCRGGDGTAYGGGGGGGGRIHFEFTNIQVGNEYNPLVEVRTEPDHLIRVEGGSGSDDGADGGHGTVTGVDCPPGLFGLFCDECPLGTYKSQWGSKESLCMTCPLSDLPHHSKFVSKRGGVTSLPCPYKCISSIYNFPNCNTLFDDLIELFGGVWTFSLSCIFIVFILSFSFTIARSKFIFYDNNITSSPSFPSLSSQDRNKSFPYLESLKELIAMNTVDESINHIFRHYFTGCNSFSHPFHLSPSIPSSIVDFVYENEFLCFVDEFNAMSVFRWWEGCMYYILCIIAYPFAWTWMQWRRHCKLYELKEYVENQYDHSCLKSCRSRALYEGLKVGASTDLMLGFIDFFSGGDEKRFSPSLSFHQRLPLSLLFAGNGSYLTPFQLQIDHLLANIISQAIHPSIVHKIVSALNAHLRTVRMNYLKKDLIFVIKWIESHANPHVITMQHHTPSSSSSSNLRLRFDVARFSFTSHNYLHLGVILSSIDQSNPSPSPSSNFHPNIPKTMHPSHAASSPFPSPSPSPLSSPSNFHTCVPKFVHPTEIKSDQESSIHSELFQLKKQNSISKIKKEGKINELHQKVIHNIQNSYPPPPLLPPPPPPPHHHHHHHRCYQHHHDYIQLEHAIDGGKKEDVALANELPSSSSSSFPSSSFPTSSSSSPAVTTPFLKKTLSRNNSSLNGYVGLEFTDYFPFLTFLLHNTKAVGRMSFIGLLMSIFFIVDVCVTLLTLLQFYSLSFLSFCILLLCPPFTFLFSSAFGFNALFCKEFRKASTMARLYNVWNVTSMVNMLLVLLYGFLVFHLIPGDGFQINFDTFEAYAWFIFPTFLLLCKCIQARIVDMYVANLEVQDLSLYETNPALFWED